MEKTQKQMIRETNEAVITLTTVLLGVPDTEETGLVGEVKEVKLNINALDKSHSKLKRNFYLLVGTLVGSGAIGSGIYTLLNGG